MHGSEACFLVTIGLDSVQDYTILACYKVERMLQDRKIGEQKGVGVLDPTLHEPECWIPGISIWKLAEKKKRSAQVESFGKPRKQKMRILLHQILHQFPSIETSKQLVTTSREHRDKATV